MGARDQPPAPMLPERGEAVKAYKELRDAVMDRDGWKCRYCESPARTADHVLPSYHGGEDVLDNLAASCFRCNSIAGKRKFASIEAKREFIIARRADLPQRRILGFGPKLQAFRSMKRLTIEKMAHECGIPHKTMDRFMMGRNSPSASALMRIVQTYDIHFLPEDFE